MTSRKTLQDFFKAARQQQPPIQPADVLRKTIVRQTVRWHTGSVISVAGVVAAGIAAVAVSLLLPNQTSVTVSRSAEQHAAPLVSPTADHEQTFSVRQPAAAIVRPAYSSTKRKSAVLSRPVQPATTPLCMHGDHDLNLSALFADSEVLRSLTIEPSAVDIICSSLSSADSLTNCTTGGTETSVQMWSVCPPSPKSLCASTRVFVCWASQSSLTCACPMHCSPFPCLRSSKQPSTLK